jgi:outer membrane protein TolC
MRMGKSSRVVIAVVGLILASGVFWPGAYAQNAAPPKQEEAPVQLVQPTGPNQQTPPTTVTLKDALDRARKLDPATASAESDQKDAREDRLQARNAFLPQFSVTSVYWNTEGDGKTTDGRFVTNDGVHVYEDWVVLHQDLSPASFMRTGYHHAQAAEAMARAKLEIARRGLTVTVTKDYYALAVAQRKYATAQQALDEAQRFLNISQAQEREGQAAHSDSVKAQIQYQQQVTAFDDARLAMEDARLDLAVLLFPDLNENFSVVDDLDSPTALPTFGEVPTMASRDNPGIRVAIETLRQADLDVKSAKNAYLPTLTGETDYGLQANAIGLREPQAAFPELGPVGTMGYQLIGTLNMPVWDWGTLRSKTRQAEYKQDSARVQLSQTQRQTLSELYAAYNEASVARDAVDKLRQTADLAAESLRLVNLRYQGGASPALEVVDAETTLTAARNAYDDGQVRYRMALASLQTLTGAF